MIDSLKVKGRIVELGMTQKSVADDMHMEQSTFSLKINNKRAMTLNEAKILISVLRLNADEVGSFLLI